MRHLTLRAWMIDVAPGRAAVEAPAIQTVLHIDPAWLAAYREEFERQKEIVG